MACTVLRLGLHIIGVHAVLANKCGPIEYESAAGDCCPMCKMGMVVIRDCEGDSSTTCKPCSIGTFLGEPSGHKKCFQCKTCDNTQGLSVSRQCTTISDTVCEVLDGFYCMDYSGSECTFALKHSQCQPGQKIKTPGNNTSDTVCEDCPAGFYSPLGINCTKWMDCSVNDETEHEEGSSVKDVKCKLNQRQRYFLIAVCALYVTCLLCIAAKMKKKSSTIKRN